jgi:hypothetical protein
VKVGVDERRPTEVSLDKVGIAQIELAQVLTSKSGAEKQWSDSVYLCATCPNSRGPFLTPRMFAFSVFSLRAVPKIICDNGMAKLYPCRFPL